MPATASHPAHARSRPSSDLWQAKIGAPSPASCPGAPAVTRKASYRSAGNSPAAESLRQGQFPHGRTQCGSALLRLSASSATGKGITAASSPPVLRCTTGNEGQYRLTGGG